MHTRSTVGALLSLALVGCASRTTYQYGVDDVIDSVAVGETAVLVTNDYRVAVWQDGEIHVLPPPFEGPFQPAPSASWVASADDAIVVGEAIAEWDGVAWTYTSLPPGGGSFVSALRCGGRTWALYTSTLGVQPLELDRGDAVALEAPSEWVHALHCHEGRLVAESGDGFFSLDAGRWMALEEPSSDDLRQGPDGRVVFVSTVAPGLFDEVPPRGASEVVLESWDRDGRVVRERIPLPEGHTWAAPTDPDLAFDYANASALPGPAGELWLGVTDVRVGEDFCATGSRPAVCGGSSGLPGSAGETRSYEQEDALYHWDGGWTRVDAEGWPARAVLAGDGTLLVLDGWDVIISRTIRAR
jgi:hypothetical protein